MVGINGISGVPEPTPERPANVRDRRAKDVGDGSQAKDDVLISSEAQAAANVARIIEASADESGIRTEKVAAAKESIERGDYKRPEVVQVVAQRISKYLP